MHFFVNAYKNIKTLLIWSLFFYFVLATKPTWICKTIRKITFCLLQHIIRYYTDANELPPDFINKSRNFSFILCSLRNISEVFYIVLLNKFAAAVSSSADYFILVTFWILTESKHFWANTFVHTLTNRFYSIHIDYFKLIRIYAQF